MDQRLHRNLFGALCILFCSLCSQAQLVYIPDTNLRNMLNGWVPGAVDASGFLDPDAPDVQAEDALTVRVQWTPADLTGLEALTGLQTLVIKSECYTIDYYYSCPWNNISVPAWPSGLTSIELDNGTWNPLPDWPTGLISLNIGRAMGLDVIPALPSGLTSLRLRPDEPLASLPAFPAGLTGLDLRIDAGVPVPAIPSAVTSAEMHGSNDGAPIPSIPASVTELNLGGFDVAELADWPADLEVLNLGDLPQVTALPPFPASLRSLFAIDLPMVASFPVWPDSLHSLTLYSASINELPAFPAQLTSLALADMPNLHCLPLLPESLLTFLKMAGDCLPNIPPGLTYLEVGPEVFVPVTTSMLCTVLNSTCDFVNPAATGSVYVDQNANGVHDVGEPGYPFSTINAQPGNITYGVPSSGDFNLPLPLDQYTLTASSINPYVLSFVPASHDAPFVNASDVDAGNDFAVALQPDVQDLRIDLNGPWGRPGFESGGAITYDNIGSIPVDGSIIFQLDAQQSWVESTPAPTSVNGNTITWDFTGLQIGGSGSIWLTVYTDNALPLGTQLQHTATADSLANDETPSDNTATSNAVVDGSWDPNDKRVEPTTLTPTEVAAGEEVIYTIRFQNTGTYQADRVIITDELSSDLQWSTMRLINSSHPCTWVLSNEGLLRFTFEPIFLPDSISDEPGSHGFVRFAMKPVNDLMLGESVGNTANIYFDFNEPVITNEAVFSVDASTEVQGQEQGQERVWPNPADDVLYVEGASGAIIEVLDVTGRTVKSARLSSGVSAIDISDMLPGMYTLRAREVNAYFVEKFTKN